MGKQSNSLNEPQDHFNSNFSNPEPDLRFSIENADNRLRLAEKLFSLAVLEHENSKTKSIVVDHFRNSALNYLEFYNCDELPERRDVLDIYYRVLPCLVCFCDDDALSRFSQLEEWRYCWPPLDPNPIEWNIVSELNIQSNVRRYLREVVKFIEQGKLDETSVCELISNLQSNQGVEKMSIAKELSLGLFALQAINNQQEDELCHHVLNLLRSHQQRARRGQLRGSDNGALALQAMMLIRLAEQKGMRLDLCEEYPAFCLLHP